MGTISFGFRISIFVILASKKAKKNKFQDPEFVTAANKNAIETPFFAIRLNWTKKSAEIAIFVQEGGREALKAPLFVGLIL